MNTLEIIKLIFGTTIITSLAALIAILGNFFNIRERYIKWKKEKKLNKSRSIFSENNPDFKFSLNYVSNPKPGKCQLSVSVLNTSKEVKFIEELTYNIVDPRFPKNVTPFSYMNGEKWPKRLEHGERFYVSIEFSSTLSNMAYQCWGKGAKVYCTTRSTTGDLLQSNSIDFDKLMDILEPISEKYLNLADKLSRKTGGTKRDIEITLWQLQFFGRLTVHIARQFQNNKIPIAEYLIQEHGLNFQKDLWFHWHHDLEEKKIQPDVIEGYLNRLL
jgi:hypothetical protein